MYGGPEKGRLRESAGQQVNKDSSTPTRSMSVESADSEGEEVNANAASLAALNLKR